MRLELVVGSSQRMPNLRNYTMRKSNIWETKWCVGTRTTEDKVETKVGTNNVMVVGMIGEMEIGEIGSMKRIGLFGELQLYSVICRTHSATLVVTTKCSCCVLQIMARTKSKQVVTLDNESDRDFPPPQQKKQNEIVCKIRLFDT
ncbi:hypothetical protein MTR67_023677 [Solanum verrucosum]|uniref:Uncharacterized protein n=1 Tax=Solanum verrucosum TaxID=315347 RepID=A0AAF0TRM0_SOLVR|nr:hypothetical protein MTR67_023677 [Solanum verrucosum]